MYEFKSAPAAHVLDADDRTGEVTFIGSVTGVHDLVGDVVAPGAYAETLRARRPRFLLGHDDSRPIGEIASVTELLPGDPRLPAGLPPAAGALVATARFDLSTKDGRDAYAHAKFFGPDRTHYSIGYVATKAAKRSWRGRLARVISALDLHELSQVLHPANMLATGLAVKSAGFSGLEFKDTPSGVLPDEARRQREQVRVSALEVERELAAIELALMDGDQGPANFEQALEQETAFVMDGDVLREAVCDFCGEPAGPAQTSQHFGNTILCGDCAAAAGWAG